MILTKLLEVISTATPNSFYGKSLEMCSSIIKLVLKLGIINIDVDIKRMQF